MFFIVLSSLETVHGTGTVQYWYCTVLALYFFIALSSL